MAGLLAFRRLKAACIKGFGACSAEGWYVYMSCALFVPQKLTWGGCTLRHFVPKLERYFFIFKTHGKRMLYK